MRPRTPWLGPLALALACGPERSFVPAGDGVDYVGALLIAQTQPERGSDLLRVEDAPEIEVPEGYSAFLYGYTADALEPALGRSPEDATIAGRLRSERGCEPRLPEASWQEALSLPGGPELSARLAPRPTAPWLSDQCPDVSLRAAPTTFPSPVLRAGADATCAALRCEAEARGCRLTWAWSGCLAGAPASAGSIDYSGRVCGALPGCVETAPRPGADAAFRCGLANGESDCRVDLYGPPRPLPATPEALELYPGRELIAPSDRLGRETLGRGLSWSMAALEDTIVVSGPGPAGQHQPAFACPPDEPSTLRFVDRASLAVVHTSTAPPCLLDLAAEPGGLSFVSAYGSWPNVHVARFDPAGRELERRRLDDLPGLAPGIAYVALEVEVTSSGRVVLLMRDQTSGVGSRDVRHEVLVLLGVDLEPVSSSEVLDTELRHLTSAGEDRVIVADTRDHSLRWLELPEFRERGRGGISNVNQAAEPLHFAAGGVDDALIGLGGGYGRFGRVSWRAFGERSLRPWAWGEAEPTASAVWPLDPALRLVALRPGRWDGSPTLSLAALALFAPNEARYIPLATLLGQYGAASQALSTREGDVWLLYPWVGRLVRVRPDP